MQVQGWIKAYRQLLVHEIWNMERFSKGQAWVDLLLLANHKPNSILIRGIEINIARGQLTWSKLNLAKRWKWNERTVSRYLKMLERRGMIQTKTSNLTTIITIVNYDLYQRSTEQTTDQSAGESTSKIQTDNNINNDDNANNTKNLIKHKGAEKSALSFSSFKGKFPISQEAVEVIEYYLTQYESYRRQPHPNLKVTQWQELVDTLFHCGEFDLDVDSLKTMIDKHFITEYQDGCDYNILHFNVDGVKVRRMYETSY